MSLRAKLIGFFCTLAVGPLAAIGIYDYVHSLRALHALIESQERAIVERAAADLRDRYTQRQSDLLLLAENAETERLYRAYESHDPAEWREALATADPYLHEAWELFGRSYRWVAFRDANGVEVYRLGEERFPPGPTATGPAAGDEVLIMQVPIRGGSAGRSAGSVAAAVRPDALLPRDALGTRFGRSGYTLVIDRAQGRVIYHPRHAYLGRTVEALLGRDGWDVDTAPLTRGGGSFRFRDSDTARVAAFTSLTAPPWTVLASSAVEEFAPALLGMRLANLLLVLLVIALTATAFVLLARRATRSLEALTAAADQVGAGNFAPALPSPGRDEVGRLSSAFALMIERVRDMLNEVERSRHMAAVGQFASQLSHEIRNPLTSLKLNLQSVARDAELGALPPSTAHPIRICLREIERLDRVAAGALTLGRERSRTVADCAIHQVVTEALDVARAQLERQGVTVVTTFRSEADAVRGDPSELKAVFLNLLVNAAEAMPDGGGLTVITEETGWSAGGRAIQVAVGDSGPGVSAAAREKIFQPFYSTKPEGTGLGLSVALRTVEEHGGRLDLAPDDGAAQGATFIVELPLAASEER